MSAADERAWVRPVREDELALWSNPPEGYEVWWCVEDDPDWRFPTTRPEQVSRKCRARNGKCGGTPIAVLNRGGRRDGRRYDSYWFYCADHLYGRIIEDGQLLRKSLRVSTATDDCLQSSPTSSPSGGGAVSETEKQRNE